MRAEQISVTDHALLRWNERVSTTGMCHVSEIVEAVKKSTFIKKNQPVPYVLARRDNTVYSQYNNILFIMEPLSIDKFKLITVITDSSQTSEEAFEPTPILNEELLPDEPSFKTILEESNWLTQKKRQIELLISDEIKGSNARKNLVSILGKIEDRLFKNKAKKEDYNSLPPNEIAEQLKQLNVKVDKLLAHKNDQFNLILQLSLKIDKLFKEKEEVKEEVKQISIAS